ncbi:MAG TPA: BrnA antitoxin family protein [Ignavibacteriales bacterium]|nr:BrnA antitoxin family protein [Ignavibacteriales bacterium]
MKHTKTSQEKTSRKLKEIPDFKSEDKEREFWATHSTVDYVDWDKAEEAVFPNLKPSTQSISIRLPLSLLDDLKVLANRMDIPYQSLIKMMLDEKVKEKYRTAI